jgi:type II secretion system protein C
MSFVLVTASVVMGMDVYATYQDLQVPIVSFVTKKKISMPQSVSDNSEKKDYGVIVRRNLFASDSLAPRASLVPRLKSTPKNISSKKSVIRPKKVLPPLNVKLVGTTVGPKGLRYAIFSEDGSRTHTIHRMGDRIQGALVKAVERGEVRLLREGRIFTLRVFDQNSNTGSRQSVSTRRTLSKAGISPSRKLHRRLSRSRLEKMTQSNPDLDRQLRVAPFKGNDGSTGIRISSSGGGKLMRQLGLRGGDVIFEVDEDPVTDKEDLYLAIMSFLSRDEAKMNISRQGKRYDIIYRIQ